MSRTVTVDVPPQRTSRPSTKITLGVDTVFVATSWTKVLTQRRNTTPLALENGLSLLETLVSSTTSDGYLPILTSFDVQQSPRSRI